MCCPPVARRSGAVSPAQRLVPGAGREPGGGRRRRVEAHFSISSSRRKAYLDRLAWTVACERRHARLARGGAQAVDGDLARRRPQAGIFVRAAPSYGAQLDLGALAAGQRAQRRGLFLRPFERDAKARERGT